MIHAEENSSHLRFWNLKSADTEHKNDQSIQDAIKKKSLKILTKYFRKNKGYERKILHRK